ncbi:MAG: hypothetical protein SVM79_09615, partial [Chloroflexota bacterium]|nr:hypothetical protein [Chloroflexota bacterium]
MSTVVKAVLIGAGVLLVLVLVLGGIGLYLLTRSTDMQAEIRAVNSDSTATRSFEQKLTILEKEIKQASAAGEKRQVELILTEEEVSATLGEMMGEAIAETSDDISGGMVVDAIVNLDDDSIRAVVGLEVQGVKVNAGVKLQANADDEGLNLVL